MRLIDADALVKDIEEYQKSMVFHSYGERMHFDDMIDFAVDHIEEAPTIDVVPVVHARWADNHCTNCFAMCVSVRRPKRWGLNVETPYCPNCGAKMDGEVNDHG